MRVRSRRPDGCPSSSSGNRTSERGAAALEFALVSTVFFTLVFGMIQYGLWFNDALNTRQGVREGARTGVVESFPSCDTATTNSEKLICRTKDDIGALTGDAYVRVLAPQGWVVGKPLTVCAMVKSDGGVGLLPMPNGGWIKGKTQMSIEQETQAAAWADRADTLPAEVNWDWCTA